MIQFNDFEIIFIYEEISMWKKYLCGALPCASVNLQLKAVARLYLFFSKNKMSSVSLQPTIK